MSYSQQLTDPVAVNGTVCALCMEEIDFSYDDWQAMNPAQLSHRECMLREVMGGIGHHIAHDYWCKRMGDPDAGLTRHQSAKMVLWMVDLLGVEEMTRRAVETS